VLGDAAARTSMIHVMFCAENNARGLYTAGQIGYSLERGAQDAPGTKTMTTAQAINNLDATFDAALNALRVETYSKDTSDHAVWEEFEARAFVLCNALRLAKRPLLYQARKDAGLA
jgi:enamine deaminase RidA (YjgF/YER057c/UK114 family)